ncbi:YiiX/YebB-like N1pC/P60 family cysteine hydrolase [Afifella sp. IM 167]|uniref:YiiX/YebB-like N1pC/P60 family cysteine hydrolase n=1 Tax=Afifella sp. IM 167 TaxID=2033586 RepID=UPI001CCEEA7E|nr:YiiX/YebB-like N1pC/P60 family cysteine hydrolase [Afifella sp. IM 167]MBZ8133685.1 lipo-like protein [Afifella sp. IM 167]
MSRETATLFDRIGHRLARLLERETGSYEAFNTFEPEVLRKLLKPGDIVLVEGRAYISQVVKYLTQSTWSHSALYVGDIPSALTSQGEPHCLIEVDASEGCISVPLSRYATYNVRICRPVGLSSADRKAVTEFMLGKIGLKYDMKNIFDLLRYFFPLPLPARWRRRAISIGSGDPTRAICSSLIAEAYQRVHYPILPVIRHDDKRRPGIWRKRREIYFIRHHSLFAPRDFDLSPYFSVVKPTLENGFNYKRLVWGDGEPPEDREAQPESKTEEPA